MLVLRLLVMVLTIICLMDGHAEVSSSTTGIRNRRESPAMKTNETEVEVLDRKKKKKPKPSKKKKPKPGKKKPKPNKAKPKPTKPVTITTTMSTSTLKTTTILTTPTITTTATTTTMTVSPTTTETTVKTTTSTASATTTLSTTTSATTTTVVTSSTASTTITTIPTTVTTSSPPTTAATTADSGAGGECKATNGKPCIFPFKDGNEEYNECKNEGGKYFWCATSVYDSGKYKHWSYCSTDGPCPLEGDDEECKATNNKPCVFPFKDGNKEYNECADHGGKYFWCATGTNSAGKYTAWSECPKDGSCPLPEKSTTPAMTSTATATSAASTTPLTTGTTAATDQMEEKVLDTLENLVLGESRDDSLQMAHMLDKKLDAIIKDLEGETSKTELSNSDDIPAESGKLNLTIKSVEDDKIREGTQLGKGLMFVLSTVDSMKSVSRMSGDCCLDCTSKYPDTELAEYWETLDTCYCYKKFKNPDVEPKTRVSSKFTTKACATSPTTEDKCCESLTLSASGGAAQHQGHRLGTYKKDGEHNNMPVYKQQEGTNVLHYFRESNQYRWSFASSVNSGGGLSSKLGDASVCPSDVKIWQYYWPGTNNLWLVDSTVAVDCEEGISDCRKATEKDCPTEHTFLEGGFTAIPYNDMLDSSHNVETKCACRHLCDVRPTECKAFLFKTCNEGSEPRCILLNIDKPTTTTTGPYKNYFAFCRRDILVTKSMSSRGVTTTAGCPTGWSEWSEYSECSPNCGPGTKWRERHCRKKPCPGSNKESVSCNLGVCDNCPEEGAFESSNKEACACYKQFSTSFSTPQYCKHGEHCLKYKLSSSCYSTPAPGVDTHIIITPKAQQSCSNVCGAKNLLCDESKIFKMTLDNQCEKLSLWHFPRRTCTSCKSESDFKFGHCFPGARDSNLELYYNNQIGGKLYDCSTNPGPDVASACPCLPDCNTIRGGIYQYPRSNACLCNGVQCPDGQYCDINGVCQNGVCFDGWRKDFQGYSPTFQSDMYTRLINGKIVKKTTSWPWIASLIIEKPKGPNGCTGVLVSCKHIITALHCISYKTNEDDNLEIPKIVSKSSIKIFLKTIKIGKGVEFKAENLIFDDFLEHDIALIELNEEINPFTEKHEDIIPIPILHNMPPDMHDDPAKTLGMAFIAGFGRTTELRQTDKMMFSKKDIFVADRKIKPQQLIIWGPTKTGVATNGDSGGPVMVLQNKDANSFERFVLAGIMQAVQILTEKEISAAVPGISSTGDRTFVYIANLNYYTKLLTEQIYMD